MRKSVLSLIPRHTGITARVMIVSSAITLVLGAAFVLLIVAVSGQRDAGKLALRSQEAITAGSELQKSVISLENGLRGFVASGKDKSLEPWRQALQSVPGPGPQAGGARVGRARAAGAGAAHHERHRRLREPLGQAAAGARARPAARGPQRDHQRHGPDQDRWRSARASRSCSSRSAPWRRAASTGRRGAPRSRSAPASAASRCSSSSPPGSRCSCAATSSAR